MNFSVGHLVCTVCGEPSMVTSFENALSFARCDEQTSDIVFEFAGRLPCWVGREFVSIDNFDIASDRIRVADRVFVYEAAPMEKPFHIMVTPAREGTFHRMYNTIRRTWRYFHVHGRTPAIYYVRRFVYYVYMPMMQLALLRRGATLAHCSAIEKNGRAILFPAWGGVGKTSIMSRYMDEGWRFISDDSCIIRDDGTAFMHPLPMHIYKYHEKQGGQLVARMLENGRLTDRILWRGLSLLKKPDALVRWVGPDKVFGRDLLCESGAIGKVIHLHRVKGLANFRVETIKPVDLAKVMASTIMDEINGLADIAIAANSACAPASSIIPDISQVYGEIADIYSKAFSSASCYMVSLPPSSNADDLYTFLAEKKLV